MGKITAQFEVFETSSAGVQKAGLAWRYKSVSLLSINEIETMGLNEISLTIKLEEFCGFRLSLEEFPHITTK